MHSAHRHLSAANAGKTAALVELFPAFREALGGLQAVTRRELLSGQPLQGWRSMSGTALPFRHRLSARQMKSVQNMVHANVSGWQALLVDRVREMITGSKVPELRKTVLYRINARKSWWATELHLPWLLDPDTGELTPCTEKEAEKNPKAVLLPVGSEDLELSRRMVRNAQRAHRFPDLRHVDTLVLDSLVAEVSRTRTAGQNGAVTWWVKASTLTKGAPVRIPLRTNSRFEKLHADLDISGGSRCGAVQLHLTRDRHGNPEGIGVSLILETPDAEPRTEGTELGMDFGFGSALFATSDGQLMGAAMLHRLRELDAVLTPYAADLQRRGVSLKTDPRYRALQQRIRSYVTNEIGRLLNRIASRQGDNAVRELVTEKLDFRGGGLSRLLNRIATRTGRGVLKTRLEALRNKHGITVTTVPSPWTSCECSGCGYTSKSNRRGRDFRCRFCGLKLHADVNASRVIRSRRSRPTPEHTGPRSRKITFQLLDTIHRKRWGLPVEGTDPDVAGVPGRTAKRSGRDHGLP